MVVLGLRVRASEVYLNSVYIYPAYKMVCHGSAFASTYLDTQTKKIHALRHLCVACYTPALKQR